MSSVEHTATVHTGLKMKIKRKNLGQSSQKNDQKHEIIKSEKESSKSVSNSEGNTSQTSQNLNGVLEKSTKHCLLAERGDRSPMKMKGTHKAEKKGKDKERGKLESGNAVNGTTSCGGATSVSNGLDVLFSQVSMEPRVGETAQMKREKTVSDPYEFNAKVEDAGPGIELPMKKMKSEKMETASSPMQTSSSSDIGVETSSVGVSTDPDCLGPCEPGTSITLEGLVWHETENGVLVVNVSWRGRTYVGTLLDATRYDWAPPRFNCESPVSDFETRTPKGRGKRVRGAAGTPVNEKVNPEGRKLRNKARRSSNNTSFQAPPSPARSDISVGGLKRKGRLPDLDLSENAKAKRCRSSSRGVQGPESPSPVLIECPEPNCNKRYKHINGLRYHQTHAHQNVSGANQDDDDDDDDTDTPTPPVTRAGKKGNASESEKNKVKNSIDKDNEDNIPLNEIAASTKAKAAAAAAAAAATATSASSNQEKNTKTECNKSDNSKSDSTSSGSSKKKDNPVTSTVTSVSSSSKVSVPTTQVYQFSGGPIGCLGGNGGSPSSTSVVTQSASSVTTAAIKASSPAPANAVTPIPIAVTAISTTPQASDLVKSEVTKGDKSKPKSATRPIVPAPSPQMIALSSSVSVTHSNLSPVSTHTQMSPSLKPIQPKPTIMGEPSGINPSLASLRKDRKEKPKKKRDKEGSNGSAAVNNNNNKQSSREPVLNEQSKCERPAVIKSASCPSKPMETPPRKDNIVPIIETPKTSHDSQRTTPSGSSAMASQGLVKGVDQQAATRLTQPPSMLKVNSPLRVTTPDPDRKTPVTEDVQSPAYSDISDANESSSPHNDSPSKKDDIKKEKVSTPQGPPGEGGNMGSHYGMYNPYYGQQYMMPNVPGSHMSPSTPKTHMGGSEGASGSDDKKQASTSEDRKSGMKKPGEKDDGKGKLPEGHLPNQPQQPMHPEYMQKYMQQVYAQIHSLPAHAQYQYLAHYGLIDPNQYHMHMMSQDPHSRQQYEKAADEKQQEQGGKDSEGNKQSDSRPSSRELCPQPTDNSAPLPKHSQQFPNHGGPPGIPLARLEDGKKSSDRPSERDIRDQNLREKQNENHQIMKENIELKSQMDRPRHYDMQYDYRNQDEMRRMQMFQQQKMYEQQKRKSSEPPELTSAESGPIKKPAVSRPEGQKAPEPFREIKKEVIDSRKSGHGLESMGKISTDVKGVDDKSRSSDKHRNALDSSKPKPHPSPSSSSSAAPSSSVSSTALSPHSASPYQPYLQYPPYMQSPAAAYGHIPFDLSNAMYRPVNPQVLGYSGTPYLHSPQPGYPRVGGHCGGGAGGPEPEKEKQDSSLNKSANSGNPEPPESDSKSGDNVSAGSPYNYGNVHKIHELGERGRPSPHRSSPAPQKTIGGESTSSALQVHTGSTDKTRDYSNSPPTQRHLHTHHHTHVVSGYAAPMYELPYSAPLMVTHPTTPGIQHQYPSK